jgi:hypothetical protein
MRRTPPKALEWIAGLLIPPACRENVLGDLYEQYTSAGQYLTGVLRLVPSLVLSRIRRMTDPQVLVMEAVALYMSFLAGAWQWNLARPLPEQNGVLAPAVPTLSALLALVLADAYAFPRKRTWAAPVIESSFALACALLSQAALLVTKPNLVLPSGSTLLGSCIGVVLIATLRMLFPPGGHRLQRATVDGPAREASLAVNPAWYLAPLAVVVVVCWVFYKRVR